MIISANPKAHLRRIPTLVASPFPPLRKPEWRQKNFRLKYFRRRHSMACYPRVMATVLKFLYAACGDEVKVSSATSTFPCNKRREELLIIMLLLVPFMASHLMWEKNEIPSIHSMDPEIACIMESWKRETEANKRKLIISNLWRTAFTRMEMKRMASLFVFQAVQRKVGIRLGESWGNCVCWGGFLSDVT